jgi:hypothetical protein
VGITVMLPEMRLLFQQYFDIVDGVCSRWVRYILIRICVFSNKLLIFRCWAYPITVISECVVRAEFDINVFLTPFQSDFMYSYKTENTYINARIVSWHILFPENIWTTFYRPWHL